MPQSSRAAGLPAGTSLPWPSSLAAAVDRCWARAAAPAEWELSREAFAQKIESSVAHERQRGGGTPQAEPLAEQFAVVDEQKHEQKDERKNAPKLERYIDSLNAPDLALACACSAGNNAAWEHFVNIFRPELYRAARAIAGDGNARELADSLYADLYGLRERQGERKSLFEYFHGRSKLSTWLRAILSQRYVDEIRRSRRTESLEEDSGAPAETVSAPQQPRNAAADPEKIKYLAMLQAILSAVLAALDPRDRLRLAYYYANQLTLAQIGRLLGEHEATVSRKLERTRRAVQKAVEEKLRVEKGLDGARVSLCLEYAREQWPFDLMGVLTKDP